MRIPRANDPGLTNADRLLMALHDDIHALAVAQGVDIDHDPPPPETEPLQLREVEPLPSRAARRRSQ